MSDLRYWIALNFLPDIGPVLARRLLSAFGSPDTIFTMSIREIADQEIVGANRAKRIAEFHDWQKVEREIESAHKQGIRIITLHDDEYPESLRNIHDAPPVLYIKGEIHSNDRYAVAMVGSRVPTEYGLRAAGKISSQLASLGLTVVSGMARGIDAASHRGALLTGGRTIAVLGSGVDVPYPRENRKLMDSIMDSGAVLSEFPLGTPPNRENFPRRNRIISALSFGVVVIEATVDSGSLITVRYALEQGREVFALPGNITSRNSRGTNNLIKNGAKLIESAEEIIEELRPQIRGILREQGVSSERALPSMTDEEKTVYGFLDSEPRHIDMITRQFDISSGKALSILLNLELKGVVRQIGGKRFVTI
jgi:DNA processing protein